MQAFQTPHTRKRPPAMNESSVWVVVMETIQHHETQIHEQT